MMRMSQQVDKNSCRQRLGLKNGNLLPDQERLDGVRIENAKQYILKIENVQ